MHALSGVSTICFADVGNFFPWWQVWFRANEQLPVGQQKSLPDQSPEMQSAEIHAGSTLFIYLFLA